MAKKISAVVNDAEMTTTVLASEIQKISEGVKALRKGKLTDDTLVLLIQHAAPNIRSGGRRFNAPGPVSARSIRAVLDGLESLGAAHLKQPDAKAGK